MFLALGIGAWTAAIFHLFTHAFFKSLLFLAAGVVIAGLHHDEDMAHMGGLRKSMPLAFWTFLVGALSLSALPLLTAGFYSKDLIIYYAWSSARGAPWLWVIAWFGAILTALYAFRMVFLVFYGNQRTKPTPSMAFSMALPLVVLAIFAAIAGFMQLPRTFGGGFAPLGDFLEKTLPPTRLAHPALRTESILQTLSEVASIGGILLAYLLYLRTPAFARRISTSPAGVAIARYWAAGWGFDWLYTHLFVRPYIWLARVNRHDFIDYFYSSLAWLSAKFHGVLSATETGNVRWYTTGVAIGAVILLAILVLR
jgi:NADH-quinone oxidoreductase subunit L